MEGAAGLPHQTKPHRESLRSAARSITAQRAISIVWVARTLKLRTTTATQRPATLQNDILRFPRASFRADFAALERINWHRQPCRVKLGEAQPISFGP